MKRVAAHEVERIVLEVIARARSMQNPPPQKSSQSTSAAEKGAAATLAVSDDNAAARERIEKVTLFAQSIDVALRASDVVPPERISIPWTQQTFRRKREVIAPTSQRSRDLRPIRWQPRMKLVSAIARARRWLNEIASGQASGIEAIATRDGLNERSARMTLSLAFLAPDIVKAAVDGTLPRGFGVSRLMDMPANWTAQRRAAGLPATP